MTAAMAGHAVAAAAQAPSFAATGACREHQAFVDGDAAAVAARLPAHYGAVVDPSSGRPLLFVRALQCDAVSLGERTAPATMASFGVVVNSPDGRGCASGAPGVGMVAGDAIPVCNWYTLMWLANDRTVVDWLRDGTPGFPAVYVPGLTFQLGAVDPSQGGEPLHVSAPAPAPSPFTMDEVARERQGQLSVRGGYWVDTPQGTVKLAFSSDDLTSGDATGVVHAQPGSEMARLFGATDRSYVPGFSGVAAERWDNAAYRKQLLGPARDGEALDSFAGSCSLQGTVGFTPAVTDSAGPLAYSYDATGTCSGRLDGRAISGAPVKVHQAGRSYGSCPQAQSTEPGQGAIAFPGGETVRYTFDFTDLLTETSFTLYGERSGTAAGDGSFLTQRTSPDVVAQCAGAGLEQIPLDLTVTTDTPLVSARPAPAGAPPTAPAAPALRLSVRPRMARAGRRTTFAFAVRGADGSPVSGAVVAFAGRRAHTGLDGSASIVATLHGHGRRTARASRQGYRPAQRTVAVRRPGRNAV